MIGDVQFGPAKPRQKWVSEFVKSDDLYMIDGARVRYPQTGGILYEHHLIADDMCVIEKAGLTHFYGLTAGQKAQFQLLSADDGLFSFLEIRFEKKRTFVAQFYELTEKTVTFVVPEHDAFTVRVRVRGDGSTFLKAVVAKTIEI
ncbi:MAG: hypothetical protein LBI11_01400 [Streptococcaceae bacterium]|jgi:hypothetical protein|nr:hypothetical protein [Streptococcaceae bacterium]